MKTIKIDKDEIIYYDPINNNSTTYDVTSNSKLVVYDYVIDVSKEVIINLNGDNAEVEYHYSSINREDNKFKITINHLSSNTISNIYNHVINLTNNEFVLDVSGIVKRNSSKCICNQDNTIINLKDGKGKILPNLLIDNYDVSSSHSAYIGSFKEEAIYYLMSRGISRKKSINLLMKSFLVNGGKEDNNIVKEYIEFLGDIKWTEKQEEK